LSKFSKHREKPKWKPKKGVMMLSNGGAIFKLSGISELEGERVVTLIITHGDEDIEVYPPYPVRTVVEYVRNGTWKIVKDGPIEPEKILKQFNFI
jgi:hypothetical protein